MIDILKEKKPVKPVPPKALAAQDQDTHYPKHQTWNIKLLLIVLLAFGAGYSAHYVPSLISNVQPIKAASYMVIITSDDMSRGQGQAAISQIVYAKADALGIELRRVQPDQGSANGEKWLQDAMNKHGKDSPCVVFIDKGGRMKCYPLPANVESLVNLMEERS